MMYSALLLAAAAVASAQVTYNSTTGSFTCAGNPNGDYCAGDSLATNIIIRCTNGVGQPGNCNDNLAGYFPYGVGGATCWQTSPTSGDAACAKNCIVEGGSGNSPTFTLPNCTPLVESSTTSSSTPTSTPSTTSNSTTSAPEPTTTKTYINPVQPTTTTVTQTFTTTTCYTTNGTTITKTLTSTTTYCPGTTSTSVPVTTTIPSNSTTVAPTTTITYILPTGGSSSYTNSTITTGPGGSSSFVTSAATTESSATKVPVGPTSTKSAPPPGFTGGAAVNTAGMGVAVLGLFVAYFL